MRLRTWLPPVLDAVWLALSAVLLALGIHAIRVGHDYWGATLVIMLIPTLKQYFRCSFTDAAKKTEQAEPDAGQVA